MERVVKLRVKVDYKTYSALKEVEEEYREVLEGAINYGLWNKTASFTRIKAEFIRLRGRSIRTYPHTTSTLHVRMRARGWIALRG